MTSIRVRALALALTVAVSVASPALALACTCIWAGPFTRVALTQPVIVLAEVLAHERHAMDVKVVEVLKGAEPRATIRIWGDNGALCRPYVSGFPVGTTWLLAIRPLPERAAPDPPGRASAGFHSPTGDAHYAISGCGAFWLEARGGRAIGHVSATRPEAAAEWARLADLLAWIRGGGQGPAPSASPL